MDSATDLILDYSLVQITESGSSVAMEKEGLRRCLEKVLVQGVEITSITTDRHTGVASLIHLLITNMMCGICQKVSQKVTKKLKVRIVGSSTHESSPFQTTCGGLHKPTIVMPHF